MLQLEPLDPDRRRQLDLDSWADRHLFQTNAWLDFVAATQRAEPVVAELTDGGRAVGYFTGLVTKRYGFRLLGSPLPGWTTPFMGFNLSDGISRRAAHEALGQFAFERLRCSHVEVRDRWLTPGEADAVTDWPHDEATTQLIDLRPDEDAIFGRMTSACRRNIRKAEKSGVRIVPADDPQFADDYYDQLRDVFAKQGLVPTYPIERVRALIEHLGPTGHLLLLRALDPDGRCIATAVLPWFGRTMYFWGGASYRPDQHLRPNEALIWHALRYARSHGVTEFDFVGRGTYKTKYGTAEHVVPWLRRSRYPVVAWLRNAAESGFRFRQRTGGRVAALRSGAVPGRGGA